MISLYNYCINKLACSIVNSNMLNADSPDWLLQGRGSGRHVRKCIDYNTIIQNICKKKKKSYLE